MPKKTPSRYVVNPLTNRNVKVGSRTYLDLCRLKVFKTGGNNNFQDDSSSSSSESESESEPYTIQKNFNDTDDEISNESGDDGINEKLTLEQKKYFIKMAKKIKL